MEFDRYSPEPEPQSEPATRRPWWPYAAAAVVLLGGVAAYLLLRGDEPPPPPPPPPPPAAEEPAAEEPAAESQVPRLGESDDWLRQAVAELSTHPELTSWLVTDNLVRRFTAAVDNVARGESPRTHLGFLEPEADFDAVERGGQLYPAPRSYARYDRVTEVIDSVDAAGAAELFRRLEPLLAEGYADLGYPDREFKEALGRAIRHLLATPLPDGRPRLEPGVESYTYIDERLEDLSPAQKHLLRTGPDNAAVILDKLREIAERLDLLEG